MCRPNKFKFDGNPISFNSYAVLRSGQRYDVCAVFAIEKKNRTNVESFNSFPKHNAISEHLSFLRRVCVQNEVTVIDMFSRCEIRFVGTFSASFYTKFTLVNVSTDSNFKALKDRKWRKFLRLADVKLHWTSFRMVAKCLQHVPTLTMLNGNVVPIFSRPLVAMWVHWGRDRFHFHYLSSGSFWRPQLEVETNHLTRLSVHHQLQG